MIAGAYVLGYLLAHPGWFVAYVGTSAVVTVVALYYGIDDGHGRHALSRDDTDTLTWVAELHHEPDEHDVWEAPRGYDVVTEVGYPRGLAYRYGRVGDMGPAPYEQEIRQRRRIQELTEAAATAVLTETPAAADEAHPPALPPPPVTRVPLPPVTAPALAVLDAFTAAIREHLDRADLQAEALSAFGPWPKWPGDDTLTSMRAIKAEVA